MKLLTIPILIFLLSGCVMTQTQLEAKPDAMPPEIPALVLPVGTVFYVPAGIAAIAGIQPMKFKLSIKVQLERWNLGMDNLVAGAK